MTFPDRLAALPRTSLARFPTPLEPLPRLTRLARGPALWIKRDDVIGPAMGGNKTRKLEFLFGEALAQRAQAVATFGGPQSNFARQMVGAACRLGLEPHCFYFVPRPARLKGNLLLNQLMGARLHFIPFGQSDEPTRTLDAAIRLVRIIARLTPGLWGRRAYFMPVGGHAPIGCMGYVLAAVELEEQLRQNGIERATIVTAAGTGGTLAGLATGFRLRGSPHTVLGIDVGKLWREFPASIAALAAQICGRLGDLQSFAAGDIPLIERTYVGAAYARPTPDSIEAARLVARLEGIVLDPVYSSKAMAGLLDLAHRGLWAPGEHVVFLHTGGLPAVWAEL